MKKILTLLLLVVVAITTNAQTPPEAFNYSAVARDANSNPIANSTIGIQISIKVGSPTGNTVYQENHFVNTDDFGLFNLIVGSGSILSGTIADVDWGADDYYLQVGMDANGGTNFLNMGSTQLLSVPYALYAKSAGGTNNVLNAQSIGCADTLWTGNGQFLIVPGISWANTVQCGVLPIQAILTTETCYNTSYVTMQVDKGQCSGCYILSRLGTAINAPVLATIDSNNNITIPLQAVGSGTVSGSGILSGSNLNITYTGTVSGESITCTLTGTFL